MSKKESFKARIEKSNKKFAALSPAEKRVQIAKDVLAQLKKGKLNAKRGVYFLADPISSKSTSANTEVKKVLKNLPGCDVCGIGSLFVCAVKQADALKINELNRYAYGEEFHPSHSLSMGSEDIRPYLERFFSKEQLHLIETAFEGRVVDRSYGLKTKIARHFCYSNDDLIKLAFGKDCLTTPTTAMTLIMKNIIENNGTFKPGKKKQNEKRNG